MGYFVKIVWFDSYVPVNIYGHVGTVGSPNQTFSWASLTKRLTSTKCVLCAHTFALTNVGKRGSSVVSTLATDVRGPLVLEVPGSIHAHGKEIFGVAIRFHNVICRDDTR